MSNSKDKIDKIDEQIKNLINEENDVYSDSKDDEHEVIVDRKYDYDGVDSSNEESTKKLDVIEDIKSDENLEDTKKIDKIDDLDENDSKDDDLSDDKENGEEDNKSKSLEEVSHESREDIDEDFADVKKSNKGTILIVVSFVAVIIFLVSFIIFMFFGNDKKNENTAKNDSDTKTTLTKNEQKSIINKYGDALKGVIAMNIEKDNTLLDYNEAVKLVDFEYKVVCSDHEIYKDGNIYLNNCKIDDLKTTYSYGEKQEEKLEEVQEDDDSIKAYVSKKSGEVTLKEPKNIDDYDVYSFNIDGKYSELTLLNSDSDYVFYYDEDYNVQMINYKKDKKALSPMNYTSILPIKYDGMFDENVVAVLVNGRWGLYNLNSRERLVGHKYDSVAVNLNIGISGPPLYIDAIEQGKIAVVEDGDYGVINYKNGEEIIPVRYSSITRSGKYLWVKDEETLGHIFDYSGKEYLNGTYDEIYGIVDGAYVLVKDSTDLKLVKVNGKTYYNYGEVEYGNYNFGMKYNDGAIFQFYKTDSSDNTCIEVLYDNSDKTGEVKDISCGGIAKPILYLYPKKDTDVIVNFEHPEYLETTYPKYNGNWIVKAKTNGDLFDNKGNYYYALYWDEKKVHSVDFSTGYYVESDDAISFLEKKLTYIGLSDREKNEFIMYWLPVLEKNGKSLVYFELTEERESYNKLNISPKPDSMLRLVIHIKKVDKKVEIKKQSLVKFQRKGFVAVEWGGTTY